jgi:glycosyltransferase involved in cell wall biosynthesis
LRVLILYTELAGYVLGNIKRFLTVNNGAEIMIVHYPINSEAPFNFSSFGNARFLVYSEENSVQIEKEILSFDAHAVLCSGWGNKNYIKWVKQLDKSVKKVICFDNQWRGILKQRILCAISRFTFLNQFKYVWVPGLPQKAYALKLGFDEKNIFTGLYPADSELYAPIGKKKLQQKGSAYPKVLISVARYIPQKDLPTLWKAFITANQICGNQWRLDCYGFGEEFEKRIQDTSIVHHGFKQPEEIISMVVDAGVYVLPSIYEPWGVAVHEMALCALPLILSDKVGSADMFLDASNGFKFAAGDVEGLTKILVQLMNMSDDELWKMAENSYSNGLKLTSDTWANTLLTILNN